MRIQSFLSRRKNFAVGFGVGVGVFILLIVNVIDGYNGLKKARTHSLDSDELHDDEVLSAVIKSLEKWNQSSKAKSRQQHWHRVKRDEEIVCYGELGCFRDEGPFDYLDMLPSPPAEISTKFLIFTRKNIQVAQTFSYFNFTSMYGNVHFNSSHPTKVIIHGFGSSCGRMWAHEMNLAILAVVEANVICVDWENGAALPNYVRAAVNTRLVGKQVALLIFWLNENLGTRTEDFHLIGFSLGAHVAGYTGQELQNLSRITGLDPAGPLFESYDPKVRLDSSDALFVDVIHSNGDSLLMGGLGSWEPMGHVDFYPNGGRVQKGCSNLFLGAVRDLIWSASDGDGRSLCNHRRAYKFFTESLSNRCRFPAFACDSYDKFLTGACFTWDNSRCGDMGYYADRLPNRGLLFLITRDDEPFCANQYRIVVESSPSSASISTYGGLEAILIGHDYINETFLITQTLKDNMVAGNVIQRMIVAHPAITEPIQIQLKYTAYHGWLYSGLSRWSMDSLILTNAYGKSMSFCTRLLLPSGIPVTIRLTAGVCLNRFPPLSAATNTVGRPISPPLQSYDTYPTQGPELNTMLTIGDSMNNTSPTSSTVVFENMKNVDTRRPPGIIFVQNGNSAEIGPPYIVNTENVDWSNWQPLANSQFRPSLGNHGNHKGTPVQIYPHVNEEIESVSDDPGILSEFEVNTLNSNKNDTTLEESTEVAVSEPPMVVRICHLVNTKTSGNNSTQVTTQHQTSCVYPEMLPPEDNKINLETLETAGTGAINKIAAAAAANANKELEAQNNGSIFVIHSNQTSSSLSIPPESFWTAMHNSTVVGAESPQYQGADPDIVLPPHLTYILQQLESQGLGPKVSTINPHSNPIMSHSGGMAANTFNNIHHFGSISQLANVQLPVVNPNKNLHLHRGLVASSRALKHRPVSLSIRRQSKLLDIGGLSGIGLAHESVNQQPVPINVHQHLTHYSRPIQPHLHSHSKTPQNSAVNQGSHQNGASQGGVGLIAQDSIQKPFIHKISVPPSFGTRLVPSTSTSKKHQPNSIFYVTSQPKGYYLMPHYGYTNTNDRKNVVGRIKMRKLIGTPRLGVDTGTSIAIPAGVPTNPTPNNEYNLNMNVNNLQNLNKPKLYEEHNRLRHLSRN